MGNANAAKIIADANKKIDAEIANAIEIVNAIKNKKIINLKNDATEIFAGADEKIDAKIVDTKFKNKKCINLKNNTTKIVVNADENIDAKKIAVENVDTENINAIEEC